MRDHLNSVSARSFGGVRYGGTRGHPHGGREQGETMMANILGKAAMAVVALPIALGLSVSTAQADRIRIAVMLW